MSVTNNNSDIEKILLYQLQKFWFDLDNKIICRYVNEAVIKTKKSLSASSQNRFFQNGEVIFNPLFSVTWVLFLYYLSNLLMVNNHPKEADAVYYLNKIMHSVDWFHSIDLPEHFMAEHPLGSVLGRASYGDYLFVYQGTTVGGNRKNGKLYYPKIGTNVIMFANSTVLGDSTIGDNVVISANTYIINEKIPENCIVFGSSPNLIIKQKNKKEILEITKNFWNYKNRKER